MTFNDVEPVVEDKRVASLTEPNMLSVRCPACGMYESVTWGSMDLPPRSIAVRQLVKRWGGRCR